MSIKVLMDPQTGEQYQVEVPDDAGSAGSDGDGHQPQPQQQQAGDQGALRRTQPMSERQIETLLANKDKPKGIREKYWGLGPKLAVTKISDPAEYYRFKLRVENALRVPFLANDADDESLLDLELIDLDAKLDLARSQTDDTHASFLELLTTLQQIARMKQENHPIPGQSSGIMGAIASRILGRGRR